MFTFITIGQERYSIQTFFGSREHAEMIFAGMAVPGDVEAIYFYGPEGQINNWLKERA